MVNGGRGERELEEACCEQEVFISCTFCRGRLLKENSATRLCLYHLW